MIESFVKSITPHDARDIVLASEKVLDETHASISLPTSLGLRTLYFRVIASLVFSPRPGATASNRCGEVASALIAVCFACSGGQCNPIILHRATYGFPVAVSLRNSFVKSPVPSALGISTMRAHKAAEMASNSTTPSPLLIRASMYCLPILDAVDDMLPIG
ncbi:MAG: hypothetical protein KatS3mg054_0092 [Chloroflexus sp.]|nr:MAG: hypothetical protein KatS3mg054_0092 [Chloroflexus sp.]